MSEDYDRYRTIVADALGSRFLRDRSVANASSLTDLVVLILRLLKDKRCLLG